METAKAAAEGDEAAAIVAAAITTINVALIHGERARGILTAFAEFALARDPEIQRLNRELTAWRVH